MPKGPQGFRPAVICAAILLSLFLVKAAAIDSREEFAVSAAAPGKPGGTLVTALRSEPKTFNPALVQDDPTREVIDCLNADLIHINRATLKTEPALATSWTVSPDGRKYTLRLRRGVRFSDGQPFNADDVVFSFRVYLDENLHSPQRDLLLVDDKPIAVEKIDEYTVRFSLAEPYAAAERLFDGIAMLPRHLLETAYQEGKFSESWSLAAPPAELAGLGPFRVKQYSPGQHLILERNPYYWRVDRSGTRLPYLAELEFLFVADENAEAIRFEAGDTDLLNRFSAENFAVLEKEEAARGYHLADLGAGLEYNFLFFNLNQLPPGAHPDIAAKQAWFNDVRFRRAVSSAIDRAAIVRLVYNGRATALWDQVTPGNKLWVDPSIPHPARSLDRSRALLKSAGFSWKSDGRLLDPGGKPVEFSIATNSSNAQRTKMAAIIEDDLGQLGMNVHVIPLEFRDLVDRLLKTYDYEAAIMGIASGDVDPTAEMNVWVSDGGTHLWNLSGKPATPWEAEIDKLMRQQEVTPDYAARKHIYDRVQEIVSENLPVICLASPNILVAARDRVGNFRPAILVPYVLWNADELYVR